MSRLIIQNKVLQLTFSKEDKRRKKLLKVICINFHCFYQTFRKLELLIGPTFLKVLWEFELSRVNSSFKLRFKVSWKSYMSSFSLPVLFFHSGKDHVTTQCKQNLWKNCWKSWKQNKNDETPITRNHNFIAIEQYSYI